MLDRNGPIFASRRDLRDPLRVTSERSARVITQQSVESPHDYEKRYTTCLVALLFIS